MSIKLRCLYLVQHMLHQIKALQFYTHFSLQRLESYCKLVKFKDFSRPLIAFQVLFKANIIFKEFYIQVLFKPVRTLPGHKKTCLPGFWQSDTQTSLISYRYSLEYWNFAWSKLDIILPRKHVTKALICLCRCAGLSAPVF